MRRQRPLLALALALLFAATRSDAALNFTLTPTTQPGTGTYAVVFSGILSNTSSSANLFLNNISITLTGPATNYLGGVPAAFFANVPGILTPGGSYSGAVFAVAVNRSAPTNTYSGTATLQGGADITTGSTLGSQSFQVAWLDSVGDGILDWWRKQYFGGTGTTTNDRSCAACDADGTGQKNLFKYVAGLDPTNPASVFTAQISTVPASNQVILAYAPAASGRAYGFQSRTNLLTGFYSNLVSFGVSTNGNQLTVIDHAATGTNRFYRVGVTVP